MCNGNCSRILYNKLWSEDTTITRMFGQILLQKFCIITMMYTATTTILSLAFGSCVKGQLSSKVGQILDFET